MLLVINIQDVDACAIGAPRAKGRCRLKTVSTRADYSRKEGARESIQSQNHPIRRTGIADEVREGTVAR